MVAISTNSLYATMALSIARARDQLATAQTEATTGQHADIGLALGARAGQDISLRNQTSILDAMVAANGLVSTRLTATQSALDAMRSSAQGALQTLASGATGGTALSTLGSNALGALTSALNASAAGEFVFGGINTGVPPLVDYFASGGSTAKSAVENSFTTTFGKPIADVSNAQITGAQMTAYLNGPFARQFEGANWTSNWSATSSVNRTATIAPGVDVTLTSNATQPGVQLLAQCYAMLSEFGGATLGADARQAVVDKASSLIGAGLADLTSMETANGATQSRVRDATSGMNATLSLLQSQGAALDGVDQYQAAATVNALTTQIQTAYELTAQLQQLSLSKYLPT